MTIKKIALGLIVAISLYSAETNATAITANKCTLGLLPLDVTILEDTKKIQIIRAYEEKGFHVSVLKTEAELDDVEFISDASVECASTYFGILAQTTIRLVETTSNKIIAEKNSSASMELFLCKIDLFSAINALPSCKIQ